MDNLPAIGRALVGLYFAFFGLWNIYHWRPTMEIMIQKRIPQPFFLLPIGICWQIILGVMIMFNIYVKAAALLLIPFSIIAICLFHAFWRYKGEPRKQNFSIFMTNITVTLGALVLLLNNVTPVNSVGDLFVLIK